MFDAVDEAIKNLLIKEIPIRNNEIEISFEQPTQEWSGRVNGPTLNVYLHDIRENRPLRGAEQFLKNQLTDGSIEIRRNPLRVDLHYLVTAWTKKEQDQHHLLGLTMMALLRAPFLPEDVCPEILHNHPIAIPVEVAHTYDENKNWSDFWTTMDNRLRPGLTLSVTLMMDPYRPIISPAVRSSQVSFSQQDGQVSRSTTQIGGELISTKYDTSVLSLIWEEKGMAIEVKDGHFQIQKIEPGDYYLAVRYNDRTLKRHKFSVPLQGRLLIEI